MRDGRPSDSARSEPTIAARSPTIATRHGVVAGGESPCGSVTASTPGWSLATVIRVAGSRVRPLSVSSAHVPAPVSSSAGNP